MKFCKFLVIPLVIIFVLFAFAGCSEKKVVANKTYQEYYYNSATSKFFSTGKNLKFEEDMKSCYTYFDKDTYIQSMATFADGMNAFSLVCEGAILDNVKSAFKENLLKTYGDVLDVGTIETLASSVMMSEEYYYTSDKIVASNAIAYAKNTKDDSLSSFEGIYYDVNNNAYFKIADGFLFSHDAKKDEFVTKTAKYTINGDIIVFTKTDSDGNIYYVEGKEIKTAYLYFTIDYPENFSISADFKDSEWNKAITSYVEKYKGQSVSVLASSFFKLP